MRSSIVLLALIAVSAASDFYLCEVVVPNFCATPITLKRDSCASTPSITLQGNDYDITTGFNVIAFGTLNNAIADTEGRMLVNGSASISAAYSIGEKIYTKGPGAVDTQYPYSAIFNSDLSWPSGRQAPDGSDQFGAAYDEKMYVKGKFTGSDDLAARTTKNTESISDDLTAAKSYYVQVQEALDAVTDNIAFTVTDSQTMLFTCAAGLSGYYIHVPSSAFAGVTSYAFSGCSSSVQMVITIPKDSTTVSFTSGSISPMDRVASKTVFNILGEGRTITFKSTRFYGIILAPNNNYAVDSKAPGVTEGIVIVNNIQSAGQFNRINCTTPAVVGEPTPCVSFETTCAGTLFSAPNSQIQGDTRDYNVISFGSFVADTGDVEGRVMARNDFTVGEGYSIGYQLQTASNIKDRSNTYSLLAGGDCVWGQGSIHPDGSGIPYAGDKEYIFCGKSFNGPASLTSKNLGGCSADGCLNAIFDAAYTCYAGYSASLATKTSNVVATVSQSAMMLTCASKTATNYVVNIDAAMFPQATYYITSNCNYQAYWTINVIGNKDVYLSGDSFPAVPGAVVYNIPGARNIYVDNTAVNGHILAPQASLNQTGGVILGKVVVGDIVMSLQINREDVCTEITIVEVPIQSPPATTGTTPSTTQSTGTYPNTPSTPTTPTTPSDNTPTTPPDSPQVPVCISTQNVPLTLDAPVYGGVFANGTVVTGVTSDGCPIVSPGPLTLIAPGTKIGTIGVPSNAGGKVAVINPGSSNQSSASVVGASMIVLAIALLF